MRNKPRIFIHMHYLELGGAEMALIGLLDAIDKDRYEVDLFLNQHTGAFMNLIPKGVNLLPEIKEYSTIERPMSYALKRGMIKAAWNKIRSRNRLNRYLADHPGFESVASHVFMDAVIDSLPSLHHLGEYDLAVSFLDPPHVVQDKVRAKVKVEWIHTDFGAIKYDSQLTYSRWAANDYIISISESISESFSGVFPALSSKLEIIENIISPDFVRTRALEPMAEHYPADVLVLCSIGRLCTAQKNFKSIPSIAKLLRKKGLKFKWFVIGPGDDSELRRLTEENEVRDCVEIIGAKTNPYPYIANCSIYVQPSLYEGKSIAVREAQILCKPVIITNYPTSASQIRSGVDGIICNMDNESIANSIYNLANDKKRMAGLSEYLGQHDYGLRDEVEKLYKFIK